MEDGNAFRGPRKEERFFDIVRTCLCVVGDVAQLGERRVRNAKVGSSILLVSTNFFPRPCFTRPFSFPRHVVLEVVHPTDPSRLFSCAQPIPHPLPLSDLEGRPVDQQDRPIACFNSFQNALVRLHAAELSQLSSYKRGAVQVGQLTGSSPVLTSSTRNASISRKDGRA
jgi:hypothetical protein